MKARAAVIAGKNKIYIREFELPEITDNELLVKVISDTVCLSTYKALIRGEEHKRVPEDVSEHPAITGHEFAGIIEKVGNNLKDKYKEGQRFVLQPAMGLESGYSPGYSYEFFGGNATYCIIPKVAIDLGCVLPLNGTYFANASLSEPMSCIIGAFHANYHTKQYVYTHDMGIKEGGNVALLGCAGPMGLGAIEYAINGAIKPKMVVVVDIDETKLNRAASLIKVEEAKEKGIELIYLNTKNMDTVSELMKLSGGKGYDDVFVFAAAKQLIEAADDILGNDGCLNFFAGPTDNNFKAQFNFYKVHYEGTHIVGTSGGSKGDMLESIELSEKGLINPSFMITHVGGLNAAPDTIKNLPNIPGGKKLIYSHIEMELTAIEDFEKLGENNEFYSKLSEICKNNNNVWCEEAEKFLLNNL
ncbi:zinc-binding dehydrogenase [Clostridium beijerinckii]|jgi:Threonine dehydrogenase and related Zn-dependent dehydrogenases|uniref:Zinc-binding dehydrogenase n=2 Tax=Clostridium beijerinckii TaxID=1520 RepID=A0AAE2RN63_CLOBE|nr:zinc-binding dehydrogenase [Clostridium beijerinckii]ABR32716.1 Alcohol dehydrogenase, zinc-binding domain protein [Clostridium beijerinckii NCIMB 8052]AIU01728.1 alcohol dehydrogenase [Clostridium beijerinckii ATCC 35702]MBF7807604.1 zinc-binding dehydrogenase [Clostridium beijerinckii]NRT26051.1 threonine dehydrogenase-like Zn-dependent dehydrogenase [Clostridium beijerinckii]NRT66348.1 threonine dehydrogenase-like Zn-dependent dehydrogenase [Clostridium beijerinckii]